MNQERPGLAELERLADCLPGGVCVRETDGDRKILYANRNLMRILGCETAEEWTELTGGAFRGMVYPGDFDAAERTLAARSAMGKTDADGLEYRVIRKDGAIRWVEDDTRSVHTRDHGDVDYALIRDITELYQYRQENVRQTDVIEGLSVDFSSIFLLNLETGTMRPYRLRNQLFREIALEHGPDPDWRNALRIYAERYVIPEDRERYLNEISEKQIRERLSDEASYTLDYRCQIPGNEDLIYMQMSVVLIAGVNQKSHAVMGYRDMTERTLRMRKEMSEKLNMELDLEREKNANEVKSSFLFNLSHDIRTPMNAIIGFTDLAKRHIKEPAKLDDYLDRVEESGRHLLSLIDDLLEMSKIDYGRVELKSDPCDLREQLEMAADLFRAQAEEKRIILREDYNLPEGRVLLDANRFRRIMGNLIGNAVKFTPETGKIKISARRKQVSDSGYARYEFTVADTGIGMTEEFMKRMYEAFEREESSTKSGYIGTGLGLSISKHLLDIMGGSISVKSKKGEGSVFTVDLPLKLADQAASRTREEAADGKSEHRAAGEHRILLVEDIEINRMLAETILDEAGFLVESVPDGCDAVDAIVNHPEWHFDLILMDIQMPVMNGYEATRAIRALNRADAKQIPIIALSANARDEDKQMSMDSGMNHHIAKPFDVANLISTVNQHIAARDVG